MKHEEIKNLRKCPICGSPAFLRKNASKRFQVKCKQCKCQTSWTDKTNAVVMWYNNAEWYDRQQGKKEVMNMTLEEAIKTAEAIPEKDRTPEQVTMLKAWEEAKKKALDRLMPKE